MTTVELNRRALLGGLAVAPVVLASSSVPAVAATQDAGLAQRIAAFRAARAESVRFHHEVYQPAWAGWKAATDAVPHYTTQTGFKTIGTGDRLIHMTTASEMDCRIAREHGGRHTNGGDDFADRCRELAEALDRREAELAAISERMRIDQIAEKDDEIADRTCAPLQAVEDYPVKTVADLIAKLTLVAEARDDDLSAKSVLADLKRINGEG